MNKVLLLCFLFYSLNTTAQLRAFTKLGTAEKIWVILHPFSANKALKITVKAAEEVKTIEDPILGVYRGSGSREDALRHSYWMAMLSYHIGPKRALWLGRAHEKKNKRDFSRGKMEDGSFSDIKNTEMDLKNNAAGAALGKDCSTCSDEALIEKLIGYLSEGKLYILKYNEAGDFLNADGEIIPRESWEGKWETNRELVPSNYGL